MKKMHFEYEMQLEFSVPVKKHRFTLRCIPLSDSRQKIEELNVEIFPNKFLNTDMDSFGNKCIYGYEENEHDHFKVSVKGVALTGLSNYENAADEHRLGMYRYATDYTKPGKAINDYYNKISSSLTATGSAYSKALYMMGQLYKDFEYVSGVTNIQTTAEEALELGKGVCQDYSHIMLSLCHLAGIPARYVVGMLVGEGLSHAWVEVYDSGMWIGLDPTNNLIVNDQHVKISNGRDYKDCIINQGVFVGNAVQTQTASVLVKEIDGEHKND